MFPSDEVHVMIDFETLGLRPDANVRSLGAVVFFPAPADYTTKANNFYAEVALDFPQAGRYIDPETWSWWSTKAGTPMPNGTVLLHELVSEFDRWLQKLSESPDKLFLWSNGTDFDIPILYSLYATLEMKPRWAYNNIRDYRTLRKLFPNVVADPWQGVKHNAYDDAWNEAAHCVKLFKYVQAIDSGNHG